MQQRHLLHLEAPADKPAAPSSDLVAGPADTSEDAIMHVDQPHRDHAIHLWTVATDQGPDASKSRKWLHLRCLDYLNHWFFEGPCSTIAPSSR